MRCAQVARITRLMGRIEASCHFTCECTSQPGTEVPGAPRSAPYPGRAVPCLTAMPAPHSTRSTQCVQDVPRHTPWPGLALAQLTHHFLVLFSMRAVLVEVEEQETKSVQNTLMRAIAYSLHPHMPVRIKVA